MKGKKFLDNSFGRITAKASGSSELAYLERFEETGYQASWVSEMTIIMT